jgi:hypothetical protein
MKSTVRATVMISSGHVSIPDAGVSVPVVRRTDPSSNLSRYSGIAMLHRSGDRIVADMMLMSGSLMGLFPYVEGMLVKDHMGLTRTIVTQVGLYVTPIDSRIDSLEKQACISSDPT